MGRSGPQMGFVADAGALIGFERNDRRVEALVGHVHACGQRLIVPAGVVAQVWRRGDRQARLARLLRRDLSEIVPLDDATARAAGHLLSRVGSTDVVDASVVWCARERDAVVVTSDPDDLRRLDPEVRLVAL
jgi:hypothetical protein